MAKGWPWVLPALAAGVLLAACVVLSGKRWFWMDEFLTFQLVSDGSLFHMLGALADQVDTTPPLYFVVAWFWSAIFGNSELALRLLSSLCFAGALLVVWNLIRRRFGFWPAAFGTFGAFCNCHLVFGLNCQARFYGMLLLLSALAVDRFDRLIDHTEIPRRQLVYTGLIHAGLVLVHAFGFVYSGVILGAMLLWDLVRRRLKNRVWLYLSVIAGWLVFLLWLGPFIRQADVSSPHFWIPVPKIEHLFVCLPLTLDVVWVVVLLAVAVLLGWLGGSSAPAAAPRRPTHLLLVGVLFVLVVPACVWVFSQFLVSIFLDRYMIPGIIGWSILLAAFAGRSFAQFGRPGWWTRVRLGLLAALALGFMPGPLVRAINTHTDRVPGEGELAGQPDLPVVCESPHYYLPRNHYHPDKKYTFLLDWQAASDRGGVPNQTVDFKLMTAMKRYYPQHAIYPSEEFLREHRRFLLLDEDNRRWSEHRVERKPNYRLKRVRGNLYLVERTD